MNTAKLDDRIKAQEDRIKAEAAKLEKLKKRREQVEAQKLNQLLKGQRAADTRRKILAGAMLLHWMETDDSARAGLMARLDAFLTRADDRKLFGFQEKGTAPEPEPQTQEALPVPSVPPAADAAPVEPPSVEALLDRLDYGAEGCTAADRAQVDALVAQVGAQRVAEEIGRLREARERVYPSTVRKALGG